MTRGIAACLAACSLFAVPGAALADGMPEEPLARFEEPVCPGIVGLQLEFAEAMVQRIRENAERFGLRLDDSEDCEPNIVVTFLPDSRDYLNRLNAQKPYLFDALTLPQKRRLLEEGGAARAWVNTALRTRDGLSVGDRENLGELPRATMWAAHSRIYVPVRRDITSSMVLIDRDAVEGKSVDQLADYATMRALARTYPEEAGGEQPSILVLFEAEEEAPAGLTAFDEAYLSRLYSRIPNLPASARLKDLEPDG
jgi:hypothetical protein